MKYDFDRIIDRKGSGSFKHDLLQKIFGAEDVIPMWVADMDFRCADEIVDAVRKHVELGVFGYGVRTPESEKAFIAWVDRRLGWKIDRKEMLVSPGVVTALAVALETFAVKGDHILLMSPVYTPFFEVVEQHDCVTEAVSLHTINDRFSIDWTEFEEKLSRSKLFLLCNPHNPGGRVWSKDELLRMGELCCKHNVIIVSDEIHCDLVLYGHKHYPMASLSEEIAQRTITAMAPSKTFNVAGAMNSVVVIRSESLRQAYRNTLERLHITFGNILGHSTMEAAYRFGEPWLNELIPYLEGNIDALVDFVSAQMPYVKVMRPEASFLVWLDFTDLGFKTQAELEQWMVKEAKVGMNSGTSYGPEGLFHMRLNIGCPRAIVIQSLTQIKKACDHYLEQKKSYE